ncbi:MAG: tRNA (5-methylaminomethyl-2-thiouridine)(34)-methyltransferase MnmD [Dysgonamonadaceae bacterium]|jgi:tRNA U34 5-methylaminomethyl-2-thiouridine-forming methyltransferase MnmC|nr:tRNA (5-methylaminomethyl-2-thiouridine)(34)-methyltransferase MnmD [Dysgonamonadaceae bacterium]
MLQIREMTDDGSHTIHVPDLNEHYHSMNGAIQESVHVYLEAGFNQCRKQQVSVLEFGFGTGLNVLLTFREAQKRNVGVSYTALEKYPLPEALTDRLNYGSKTQLPGIFKKIHDLAWDEPQPVSPFFSLKKVRTDFFDYDFPDLYDVVYYDAFAPDKQPEVWSPALFGRIYECMYPQGILTTYCAKGEVRRMLQRAGFTVARLPGPPGKREMLSARKER